jgi:Na+/proline symporter
MLGYDWFIIAAFILFVSAVPVTAFAWGYGKTKESFLLSLRNIGPVLLGVSLAMAWANSPSVLLASAQAYNVGLVGWFWFAVGNILTLACFGFAAQTVRKKLPEGYTLAGFFRETHGNVIHKNYLFCAIAISVLAMCISLVGISTLISITSGISKLWACLMILALSVTLSIRIGFRATVLVEAVKFVLGVSVLGGILYFLSTTPAILSLANGFSGVKGTGGDIFSGANSWTIFATFGVITFFGQMSAPWVDNNFMQRAFSFGGDKNKIWVSFLIGSICFAFFPVLSGLISFYGVANGVTIPNGQGTYALYHVIDQLVGPTAVFLFCSFVMVSCVAIVDDQMNNISALIKHDIIETYNIDEEKSLVYTRYGAICFALLAIAIVNVPFVNLTYILLLGYIIRASLGLTTVGLIFRPHWFDGKITGFVLVVSLLLTGIGFTTIELTGLKEYILALTLTSTFGTPLLAFLLSKYLTHKNK